jgi:hypothetical protein
MTTRTHNFTTLTPGHISALTAITGESNISTAQADLDLHASGRRASSRQPA